MKNFSQMIAIAFFLAVNSVTLNSQTAHAQNYGMAGCGLGSLIIKKDGKWEQVAAAIINNFFFPGSFPITSAVSGCENTGSAYNNKDREKEIFISANLNEITKQAAQGDGEYIDTLGELFGCKDLEARKHFKTTTKNNYNTLFSNQEPKIIILNYNELINNNALLQKRCKSST